MWKRNGFEAKFLKFLIFTLLFLWILLVFQWNLIKSSILSFPETVHSLKCYQCTILPPPRGSNLTERLCTKFDHSDHYVVDCPYSTMCMKRIYRLKLLNGEETESVTRDCAQQKFTQHVRKKYLCVITVTKSINL